MEQMSLHVTEILSSIENIIIDFWLCWFRSSSGAAQGSTPTGGKMIRHTYDFLGFWNILSVQVIQKGFFQFTISKCPKITARLRLFFKKPFRLAMMMMVTVAAIVSALQRSNSGIWYRWLQYARKVFPTNYLCYNQWEKTNPENRYR